jgi:3'-phosphoadenosine 5'-phosphosulfate sulfotransferase (PAPS reductase)/FAD synthetase
MMRNKNMIELQNSQFLQTIVNGSDGLMVTVSGGRSSAMMARHIQTHEKYSKYEKVFVFCNTGMERPETINFLKNIEKHWKIPLVKIEGVYSKDLGTGVKYKIVDWEDLDMKASTFSKMIEHKNKGIFNGLPNQDAPYCSENLKTLPAKKLCDDIFGVNNYKIAIGFRKEDMPKRISWAEIKEQKQKIFPLLTDFYTPISQLDLNKHWKKQPFKLELHGKYGNCEICWKKSEDTLIENILYGTRFIKWQEEEENKYESTSFRGHKSIKDIVKMAELPRTIKMKLYTDDDTSCVCNF